ncbi:energy transducer TonB [Algoriphagus sp.]|uniref:energy transducer TonB n=1 Tax=Algoriphagus sp. TaxID=1872435 RepID=UPI002716EDFB|nr:energy transducer TonB [Algoriphagus sp.]MDO8967205.1 energy transducer TonB [Algoriphagus sp.]MDP3199696.1 energy transducer TonB [Algoriphagus sp.]
MKIKILFSLITLLFFGFVSKLEAQVTMSKIDGVYQVVPDMPVPPGGSMESFIKYFQENMKYPALAKEKGIEGMVAVSFIVREDGSVDEVAILRGIGGGCDEEAHRMVRESGKWTPGKLDGKPVAVQMRLPIQFKL